MLIGYKYKYLKNKLGEVMKISEAIKELEKSVKSLRQLLATDNEDDKTILLNRLEATEIALSCMRKEI